jgi:hypothetical protein
MFYFCKRIFNLLNPGGESNGFSHQNNKEIVIVKLMNFKYCWRKSAGDNEAV